MKTILVTGGAGFIGSNLCRRLIKENNYVICMDNLFTGSLLNIKDLLDIKNFEFIHQDVQQQYDFYVDQIYNLACPASPKYYQFNKIETFKTCIIGAINALDLATKYKASILQASTSEVYGDALENPQKESYWGNVNCTGIRSCYDEGKRGAETLFFDYCRQYQTNIKVVRIFNTYGPGMGIEDGRVVSNFIVQALKDIDITVYGTGEQTRSFNYIDDLLDGFELAMNSNITGPINIGNPDEYTIIDIAKKIIKLTNSKSKIIYSELPEDDPKQRQPSISSMNYYFSWKPKVKINDGLNKTIDYFKSII